MLSIEDDVSPHEEAEIATEIVLAAHWIQRHEYAIRIAQDVCVTVSKGKATPNVRCGC
jgi:hypothetical protein